MSALSDLLRLDIASARKGLADKQFTARELTEAYLAAADDARALNGFITETPDQALADADAADARLLAGNATAMTGMPIAQSSLLVRLFSTKAQFIALMLHARTLLSCGFPASVNP